ncbi:MAG: abortive infection protein [Pedosphaera sp.]|nr:abortive infection protein [Pedosphaera sp.]
MLSEKPWTLDAVVRMLFGLLVAISATMLVLGVYQQFILKHMLKENEWPMILIGTLSLDGFIIVAVALFLRSQHLTWAEAFGFTSPGIGKAIGWAILVAILFLPVGNLLQTVSFKLLDLVHYKSPVQHAVATLQTAPSLGTRIYMILFAVVAAPIAEESLFRGILYPTLKKYGNTALALWVSSVIFGVIHLNFAIFLPLMVLGMALAWLYEKTNNLLACIVAHGLFNAINVLALFFGEDVIKYFSHT